ncbi:NAD-dependent epimerase/dehydratase family protein [Actinoplanes sp. NPDC048967]|uniref:NAD-dependent epimerase/dehydratase family protein n=1 Tax=Actinoplanes sp. NPDC048967 TaxID=3155269 RepID=UPI0033D8D4ED
MTIVVTGGTGYLGSALIAELVGAGHSVTALVRNEAGAGKATALGARAAVGDLFDTGWLTEQFAAADAVAHLAATGDATTRDPWSWSTWPTRRRPIGSCGPPSTGRSTWPGPTSDRTSRRAPTR